MASYKPPGTSQIRFVCPYCHCPDQDYLRAELIAHCVENHGKVSKQVVCPICALMPWGNRCKASNNFVAHLQLRHQFEYDDFMVDVEQDDDTMLLEAMKQSILHNVQIFKDSLMLPPAQLPSGQLAVQVAAPQPTNTPVLVTAQQQTNTPVLVTAQQPTNTPVLLTAQQQTNTPVLITTPLQTNTPAQVTAPQQVAIPPTTLAAGHPPGNVTTSKSYKFKIGFLTRLTVKRSVKPPVQATHQPTNLPVQVPTNPAVQVPTNPAVQVPTNPAVPVPINPAVQVPTNPAVPVPINPAVQVPTNPAVQVPTNPAVPVPINPAVQVPTNLPVQAPRKRSTNIIRRLATKTSRKSAQVTQNQQTNPPVQIPTQNPSKLNRKVQVQTARKLLAKKRIRRSVGTTVQGTTQQPTNLANQATILNNQAPPTQPANSFASTGQLRGSMNIIKRVQHLFDHLQKGAALNTAGPSSQTSAQPAPAANRRAPVETFPCRVFLVCEQSVSLNLKVHPLLRDLLNIPRSINLPVELPAYVKLLLEENDVLKELLSEFKPPVDVAIKVPSKIKASLNISKPLWKLLKENEQLKKLLEVQSLNALLKQNTQTARAYVDEPLHLSFVSDKPLLKVRHKPLKASFRIFQRPTYLPVRLRVSVDIPQTDMQPLREIWNTLSFQTQASAPPRTSWAFRRPPRVSIKTRKPLRELNNPLKHVKARLATHGSSKIMWNLDISNGDKLARNTAGLTATGSDTSACSSSGPPIAAPAGDGASKVVLTKSAKSPNRKRLAQTKKNRGLHMFNFTNLSEKKYQASLKIKPPKKSNIRIYSVGTIKWNTKQSCATHCLREYP